MGRAKLPMKRISLDKNRNITYKKRRSGIMKKVSEFATLCDVSVCMICMGPPGEPLMEAATWPEDRQAVEAVVEAYLYRSPEERNKRKSGLSTHLAEQMKKFVQELERRKKENLELVFPSWDPRLDEWSVDYLTELVSNLDVKIEMVNKKIESMKGKQSMDGLIKNPKIDPPLVPFSCARPATNLYTSMIMDPLMNSEGPPVLHDQYISSNSFNNFSLCPSPLESYGHVFSGTAINYNVTYQNYNQAVSLLGGSSSSSSSIDYLPQPMAGFSEPAFTQLPSANQLGDGFCCTFQSGHKY